MPAQTAVKPLPQPPVQPFAQSPAQTSPKASPQPSPASRIPDPHVPPRVAQAQRFLAARGLRPGAGSSSISSAGSGATAGLIRSRRAALRARPMFTAGESVWQPLGPDNVLTPYYGAVTGRIASIAFDPSDATGNTVYIGSTGGGVWASENAATSDPSNILFTPLTDAVSQLNGAFDPSISIGAVSVQPGGTGVVLAGTGDPNDALDSYYGAGILRSTDNGASWSLIYQSADLQTGAGNRDFAFTGLGFAGFAWSGLPATPWTVVAAVSEAYEGLIVGAQQPGDSSAGLYYSNDAGATWHLSRIEDLNGQDVQGPLDAIAGAEGNPATAVVWNPVRNLFIAAVRYHGYYSSPDGVTWTRLANQPGAGLTAQMCPTNTGQAGSPACPIFRGALAVNPQTGDTFAWTVDLNNQDQGLWQDVCAISGSSCTNGAITFGTQWSTTPLETSTPQGPVTIENGDYNLALAAVPSAQDTLLMAGANDLWKCSLAADCAWRNTTNALSCLSAGVGPYQHALAWNLSNPLNLLLGNDSGLWRSMDDVGETGSACASTDASHFQNLNGGLGSLAEVESMPAAGASPYTTMLGLGVNGTAGVKGATDPTPGPTAQWPQILSGEGGPVAIDPSNPNNWYVNNGAGVSIHECSESGPCTQADFGLNPNVTDADVGNDGLTMTSPAPFLVDPADPTQLLIGTCRVWRGPASGTDWTAANAISPMLDGNETASYCDGNALIRSMAALPLAGGGEIVYVGMYGPLDGGAAMSGQVFSATMSATGTWSAWTNLALNPVSNEATVFNPYYFDISSIVIDPSDPTGNTLYATIEGFPSITQNTDTVYRSTNGGASWQGITSNLYETPANAVAIDPGDSSGHTVYVATDFGVYATQNVGSCATAGTACWQPLGAGLPESPVVGLGATPSGGSPSVLVAATYGRGLWQIPLLTSGTQLTTATLAPTSLSFTAQAGSASSPQPLTVMNTGGLGLSITSVAVTGAFTETDNCAGQEIVAGSTCAINVIYTPASVGSDTGQVTVYGSMAGGSLSAALSGTAIPAGSVTLTPGVLSFGNVEVGTQSAAQQATAQNANTTPVPVTALAATPPFTLVTNGCGTSLAASSDCSVSVAFTPISAGPATGTLTLTDGAGTLAVQLTGTGTTPPTDALAPSSLSFSGTIIGQPSAAQTVTLTNSGQNPLTGVAISVTAPFEQTTTCTAVLAAQASCTVNVVFLPTAQGAATGTLTVTDALHAQTVSLSGTGLTAPVISLAPTTLGFSSQPAGVAGAAQTVTVTNSGGATMGNVGFQITGAGTTGAAFSLASTTCGASLAAGASCTAQLVFTPNVIGGEAASLAVSSSTLGVSPATVALSGTGTGVGLAAGPAQLSYASEPVGQPSPAQSVTVTNVSPNAAAGLSVAVTGPFSLTANNCPASLAGGASCTAGVVFTPIAGGQSTGQVTVNSTWALAPASVALSGIGGLVNAVQFKPGSVLFSTTGAGQTSSPTTVTISNASTTQALTNLALAASQGFTLVNNTCGSSLAANANCTVGVEFTPASAGAATGTLTVTSGVLAAPAVMQLAGTGFDFSFCTTGAASSCPAPAPVTVASGLTADFTLSVVPLGGAVGPFTFAFQCGTLPEYATCSYSPTSLNVSGGATGTQTIDITTSQTTAMLAAPHSGRFSWHNSQPNSRSGSGRPWLLAGGLLLLLPLSRLRIVRLMLLRRTLLAAAWLAVAVGAFTSCSGSGGGGGTGPPKGGGGGSSTSTTPPGTYTIPVTVQETSTGVTHSITLTLTVD
jgi:hypothetical protein